MKTPLSQRALSKVTMLLGFLVLSATTSLSFANSDKDTCAKAKTEKECKGIIKVTPAIPAPKISPRCKWSSNDDGSEICKPA